MLRCLFKTFVGEFRYPTLLQMAKRNDLSQTLYSSSYSTQATKLDVMNERDKRYEQVIRALNGLQSNMQDLASRSDRDKNKIAKALKYAERVEITVDDIDKLSVIHVSGTKGKGSTCAMAESILHHHGYKTGFYSSPHMVEVRERIRINGQPLSREAFTKYFWEVYDKLVATKSMHGDEMPFYFAFLTIMAFHVFISENVDVAVMEVGIGGQYDTTNVIRRPVVCGVTSLGLDHTSILGNTIEEIAWQKGGIFKPGVPAVTVPQEMSALQVLMDRAEEIGASIRHRNCVKKSLKDQAWISNVVSACPLYLSPKFTDYGLNKGDTNFRLGLMGEVQEKNAALALQLCRIWLAYRNTDPRYQSVAEIKKIENVDNIPVLDAYTVDITSKKGLEMCRWKGRNQIISKPGLTYYLDGAHTKESLEQCINWFMKESSREATSVSGKVVKLLIFNMTGDRDFAARLEQLKIFLSNFASTSLSSQACVFDHVVFSPNWLYMDYTSPDTYKISSPHENQLNRCSSMKEVWDSKLSPHTYKCPGVKLPEVQMVEKVDPLPVSPLELENSLAETNSRLTSKQRLSKSPQGQIPSSVLPCLHGAIQWASQGREALLPVAGFSPSIPEHLRNADHVQILVTGSIHLVGGVLRLIEADFNSSTPSVR